nr:hypothetical protein [uncultured Anaerocolumna sp.]
MAEQTTNFGLIKPDENDFYDVGRVNTNTDKIDAILGNVAKFEKASGTGASIILNGIVLEDGVSKTFIVSADNNGVETTINGKKLYKQGTTTTPSLIAGKAVTIWYDSAKACFFLRSSAEGNTPVSAVLDGYVFSDEEDTGKVGTMPDRSNEVIPLGSFQNDSYDSILINTNNGYHNNTKYRMYPYHFQAMSPDLLPENIIEGKDILGVQGGIPNMAGEFTPATANKAGTDLWVYNKTPGYYPADSSGLRVDATQLVSGNIKNGVTIFGVQGSPVVVDTTERDYPAQPQHILKGWVAFCNGARRVGTFEGKQYATGTKISSSINSKFRDLINNVDYNCGYVRISEMNIGFTPSVVILASSSRRVTWFSFNYIFANYVELNSDHTTKSFIHTISPSDYIAIDANSIELSWYAWG